MVCWTRRLSVHRVCKGEAVYVYCVARQVTKARWQSGYAAACKAVYAGSIPTRASIFLLRLI